MKKTIERIAREVLCLKTLERRMSERLDFHDLAVWQIKEALQDAYVAGVRSKCTMRERQLTKELETLIARSAELIEAIDGTICDSEPEFRNLRWALSRARKALAHDPSQSDENILNT